MGAEGRSSTRVISLAIGLGALVAVLLVLVSDDAPASSGASPVPPPPEHAAAEPGGAVLTAARPELPPAQADERTRWWQPGQEHDYGQDVDPFVRQPQDYDSNTPRILGNRISYHVYDLELVQDMIRRGDEPESELAQVRGAPLTAAEREAARRLLQAFFDETVPDVDAILGGDLSRDRGYERIGPRRRALDRELRRVLGLTEKQVEALWPHLGERERIRDQLRD